MPNQSRAPTATSFIVSLISNIVALMFGSKETVLNPAYAQSIWDTAIKIPLLGSYISTYLNPQLLLGIVSFLMIWLVAFSLLGFLGKVFGGLTPFLLIVLGVLIAGVFFGIIHVPDILARFGV